MCVCVSRKECHKPQKRKLRRAEVKPWKLVDPSLVSGGVLVKPETNRISAFENPRKCRAAKPFSSSVVKAQQGPLEREAGELLFNRTLHTRTDPLFYLTSPPASHTP
jgi:hypothetical protein